MAERTIPPTSAQETSPLHERGGLTPEHWQEIIRKINEDRDNHGLKDEISNVGEEIVNYGQRVLSTEYPDTGFHHRGILTWRHWNLIRRLSPYNLLTEKRKSLFWESTERVSVHNPVLAEIKDFAEAEFLHLWGQEYPIVLEQKRQEIHEAGLSMEHLQEILKLGNRISPKILGYSQAVIEGKISDVEFQHREYLGNRHWDELLNKLSSKAPTTPLEREIAAYAYEERYERFTLDDYFDQIIFWTKVEVSRFERGRHIPDDIRSLTYSGDQWFNQLETSKPDYAAGPVDPFGADDWGRWRTDIKDKQPPNAWDLKLVSNRWLLEPEDVDDLIHTSPEQLVHIARNRISVDVLTTRLRDYLDRTEIDWQKPWYIILIPRGSKVRKIRGWEKPIPQVA